MVRVALAGVGGYGNNYARALLEPRPGEEVVFSAGIDPFASSSPVWEQLAQAKIPLYADMEQFLNLNQVDVMVISSPIHLHTSQTQIALAHGAAVLCEKPLAATLEDGLAMLKAEHQYGLPVGIGYQWSFSQAVQAFKRDVQAGVLGRPLRLKTMVLWPRRLSYYQRSAWAGRVRMPTGEWVFDSPVNNATAHYLHNMLYLLGSQRSLSAFPSQVQAELYCANDIENFDSAALRLWTEDGVEVLFYTTHTVNELIDPVMQFEFEHAVVSLQAWDQPDFIAEFRDGTLRNYGSPNEGHTEKLWYFLSNLREGTQPDCGILAALPQTLSVYAIHRSVPQPVRFPKEMLHQDVVNDDPLIWVEGLADCFKEAYDQGVLPVELSQTGWTSVGRSIDLSDEVQRIKDLAGEELL